MVWIIEDDRRALGALKQDNIPWKLQLFDWMPTTIPYFLRHSLYCLNAGRTERCSALGRSKATNRNCKSDVETPFNPFIGWSTSALDSESEKSVQDAIVRVMFGRTTVVVAHRLSSIQNADMIVFVQNGRVLEVGSQKELLEKQGGAYAALVKQWDQPQESTKLSRWVSPTPIKNFWHSVLVKTSNLNALACEIAT